MKKASIVIFSSLVACSFPDNPSTSEEAPPASTSTSTGAPSEPGSTGSSTSSTGTSSTGDPGSTTVDFIVPPDGGSGLGDTCNTFTQDCPAGQKCTTSYFQEYGDYLDHCVDLHPQPLPVGQPCELSGEFGVDGDNCQLGALCWDPDPKTGIGMCVELCGGTEDNAVCQTPGTYCAYGKSIQLCLQTCEPRDLDTCPVGCTCIPATQTFMCALNASGDLGLYADPCEFANACDPGHFCANSDTSPDCDPGSPGCCIPFCTTTTTGDCPANLECLPWWGNDPAPSGYENLGSCGLAP